MTLNLSVYRVSVQRRRVLNCVFHSILHVSDSRSDRQSACQERLAVIQQCHSAGDLASTTDSALSQPLLVCQLAVDRASLTHSAPLSPLLVCVFLCRRRWTLRCDQRFSAGSWSTSSFGMRLVTGRTGVKSSTLSSFCGTTILSVMRLRPNGFSNSTFSSFGPPGTEGVGAGFVDSEGGSPNCFVDSDVVCRHVVWGSNPSTPCNQPST